MKTRLLVSLALLSVMPSAALSGAALTAHDLRCEYRSNPLGIDTVKPQLSWILESEVRGQKQSAYRVLVATSLDELSADRGDLWDSGKLKSDQSVHVVYRGRPLESGMRCYWKVRVWDTQGRASAWSAPALWSMGLLEPADWGTAQWIGASDESGPLPGGNGYHGAFATSADTTKWVAIDLGVPQQIDTVRLFPARPWDNVSPYPNASGYLFPVRFKIEVAGSADFCDARTVVDHTDADVPNPGANVPAYSFAAVAARHVRLTVTKLRLRDGHNYGLALAEMCILAGGQNVALGKDVSASDAIENETSGWSKTRLVDGRTKATHPGTIEVEAVMLRKEVDLPKQPRRATATLCGLGYYELTINGQKVGDHVLDPGFTGYNERVLYVTHDVTKLLKSGRSAIGVLLGNGWYNQPTSDVWGFQAAPWIAPPKLLLRIDVEYDDGSSETIRSDGSWKVSTDGPIVYNCIRGGETCDARKAMPGWDRPGYDDSAWANAKPAAAPAGRLQAQAHPPIRVVESMRPVALTEPKPGVYVFDLGVNTAGWARLTTRGERGRKITLGFNEALGGDGTVDMNVHRGLTFGRYQTGEFILAGKGVETYEPRFTYHGFRYVQVTGLAEKPTLDSLTGIRVHTDLEPAGEFTCSNPQVNRIQETIVRTQLTNLHGVPTDCPHREKIGWTGDGYITMEEAIFNFRMPGFYWKWWRDMLDVQDANGHASCIAPSPGWGRSLPDGSPHFLSDPWWGGALVRLPWKHYRYYGDRRILEEAYEPMKKYLDYVATQSPGHISWSHEGDWLPVSPTPPQLTGTAAYFRHAKIVAEIAELLGKPDEAAKYSRLAEEISSAFHQKYFDAAAGLYAKDSQTAQVLPLFFGMTPAGKRPLVLERLIENITQTRNNHISSGIIGTYYVFQTLMEEGHDDVAYAMLTQKDYPGWLHMLNSGGTTIWESWNGGGSRNHPALGSVGAWLYEGLAGIRLDPTAPGFKKIVVKPAIVGDLTWVKAHHGSLYGRIVSNWKRQGERLTIHIAIPANTTATVYIPTTWAEGVAESGQPAAQAEGVTFLRAEPGAAVYEVGSGHYTFEASFSSRGASQK